MRAGVVHASSALLHEFAPSKAAAVAAVERAGGGGEGGEGGGNESGGGLSDGEGGVEGGGEGGVASAPPATPSTTLTAAPSTALVPATARAALVAAAERAKADAVAGAEGKKAKAKAGSRAVCQALRDALQRADDPRELLDPVDCSHAVSTARRTYHELVTGEAPGPRTIFHAEDGAPWPTDRREPPGGLAIFATGLQGADPVQNALAKLIRRYAGQAIVRNLHRRDIILFKPTVGEKQKSLCFLMCAATRAPLPATPTHTLANTLTPPHLCRAGTQLTAGGPSRRQRRPWTRRGWSRQLLSARRARSGRTPMWGASRLGSSSCG